MLAALKGEKDLFSEIVPPILKNQLENYHILIAAVTRDLIEQREKLLNYVESGGRAMLLYTKTSPCGASNELFPDVVKGAEPSGDRIIKPVPDYGINSRIHPFELRCSGTALHRGPEGVVFLRNRARLNTGIAGNYGKGKVLFLGFPLGVDDSGEELPLAGCESELLLNAVRWLSGEERYEIPEVYMESREIPELSKEASKIIDRNIPGGKKFRAGAARIDITPSASVVMRGFKARQSTGVHDRLHVRALILDNGEDQLVILSWEKLNCYDLPEGFKDIARIRREIRKRIGIPESNILINSIHTHSGSEGPFEKASIEAVEQAWKNMKDARIGIGSKKIYGVGSSRRLPEGKGLWGSRQPNPDGVMDNECGVIRIEDYERNAIAVVTNYSSHPTVLHGENTLLSGDYAGIGMAEVERRLGGNAVSLFLQGCAGNTGTQTFRKSRTIPEAERLGRVFADEIIKILEHIDVVSWLPLKAKKRMIDLPRWEPQKPEHGTTMPFIPGNSIPDEIQALVIGDSLIMALGSMEPYVEIGLDIKEASKFHHTFVLGYSNGPWMGYLPSNLGYSVNETEVQGTRFSPEAPDTLVRECLALHNQVSELC